MAEFSTPFSKQLSLDYFEQSTVSETNYRDKLKSLLDGDLDFHYRNGKYATHSFHSFPAKFPPQLPSKFIHSLTSDGDVVLDPMMGSGTTVVESILMQRKGIGVDIDPLAIKIAKVKTNPLRVEELSICRKVIVENARNRVQCHAEELQEMLAQKWDSSTSDFINYWFAADTQLELLALVLEISNITQKPIRDFFELALSATIITKSGGVSLALDLAHTRPHKAKVIISQDQSHTVTETAKNVKPSRLKVLTKKLRSAIDEFEKRCSQNMNALLNLSWGNVQPDIICGDAQELSLQNETVDLIVTSPPYASNAIDYMRAHKFSLIWLGYSLPELGLKRQEYIGGERTSDFDYEYLPTEAAQIVKNVWSIDEKRGQVLHRYYSEMTRVLREMYRVLKPKRAAIVVVGNSIMRGIDSQTQNCLAEIGRSVGFEVPKIGIRSLDRNKRMLPAGSTLDQNSQIQKRMHFEYVIGFYKKD